MTKQREEIHVVGVYLILSVKSFHAHETLPNLNGYLSYR